MIELEQFEIYAKERFAQFIAPEKLLASMSYSLFSEGKRIRPLIMFAVCSLQNIDYTKVFPAALALEMVHTYSLIHDDLPCMDNDVLRRGKPTNHIAFDEATALLAGDALLSQSFEVLLETQIDEKSRLTLIKHFSQAIGVSGMVAGQVRDMALDDKKANDVTLQELREIHYQKTGKLFEFAILAPTVVFEYSLSAKTILNDFAKNIGILFQAMDDYLDVTTEIDTGKTKGIDQINGKITYLSYFTLEELQKYIADLEKECEQMLDMLALEGYEIAKLKLILQLILRK